MSQGVGSGHLDDRFSLELTSRLQKLWYLGRFGRRIFWAHQDCRAQVNDSGGKPRRLK
jgi:hypothetical protein